MQYVSIDIETTGLNPDVCQILEFAAVLETDWKTPVEDLPYFSAIVQHPSYVGEPYALAMNSQILAEIAAGKAAHIHHVVTYFTAWLESFGITKFTPAGKNFNGFDKAFLRKLPDWNDIKCHRRAIDPGMLYWRPEADLTLPDTKECCKRAGIPYDGGHRALDDARQVIQLVRAFYGRNSDG